MAGDFNFELPSQIETITEDNFDEYKANYDENKLDGQAPLNENIGAARMQVYMDFLGKIERENKCSGICKVEDLYYFSDINIGIPESDCGTAIKRELFWKTFGQYGIGVVVTGFFFCIPYILNCILCFLPGKGNVFQKIPGNII